MLPDFTFKEVNRPENGWCENGHKAPESFRRGGQFSEPSPTRFFCISGKSIDSTTICEPCLMIINWRVSLAKNEKEK